MAPEPLNPSVSSRVPPGPEDSLSLWLLASDPVSPAAWGPPSPPRSPPHTSTPGLPWAPVLLGSDPVSSQGPGTTASPGALRPAVQARGSWAPLELRPTSPKAPTDSGPSLVLSPRGPSPQPPGPPGPPSSASAPVLASGAPRPWKKLSPADTGGSWRCQPADAPEPQEPLASLWSASLPFSGPQPATELEPRPRTGSSAPGPPAPGSPPAPPGPALWLHPGPAMPLPIPPLKPCPALSSPRLSPCRISDPCPSKPDPAGPAWAPQGARSPSPPASSCQDPASQAPIGSAPSLLRPRCWPPVSPSPDSKPPLKPPGRLRSPPLPPWSWSTPRPGTLPPSSSRKPSLACPGPHAA